MLNDLLIYTTGYYISQFVRALQLVNLRAVFYRTDRKNWKALNLFTAVVLYTEKWQVNVLDWI